MAANSTVRDDETGARALLERASRGLPASNPDVPASFASQLYGRTVPEDLLHYGAADLAMLAARAYGLLGEREPGKPKIRCANVGLQESTGLPATGVVEIVNDDMPFLLDSVMGELAERRLAVRLVAHPVLDVERRGGKLASVGGAGAGTRESFIHLHVDGLADDAACASLTKAVDVYGLPLDPQKISGWRALDMDLPTPARRHKGWVLP